MMERLRITVLWAVGLTLVAAPAEAIEADAMNAAMATITADESRQFVEALADDTFEGRDTGSRGNRAAGLYIVERLKKLGLAGGGPGGRFYQSGNGINNILALVEGRDPLLKPQTIVVGGHYDHVGYGTYRNSYGPVGLIHNGADDNASGVAAILEVAEAVMQLPERPKRSILFACWDGEEDGLIGSKYWIENPTVPLAKVPLMMNVDMVGRLRQERCEVIGIRTMPGLRRIVSRRNEGPGLFLDFNWEIRGDSDHYPFFSRDIPVVMFHTGKHEDYHRPSDDAEKINAEGIQRIAQVMFGTLVDLAEAPDLAGFRSQSRYESNFTRRTREVALPPPPGRLGVRWDEHAAKEGKIVVTAVSSNSAADVAGLRAGDRILKVGDYEVDDAQKFRQHVLAAKSPASILVLSPGEGQEPRDITLNLPGNPVLLGISWRTDDAEPGAVIVNRLTPGSPADMADLRHNDRIYRINGREFASGEEFRQFASESPTPMVLEVESGGRVRTVEVSILNETGPKDEAVPGPVTDSDE